MAKKPREPIADESEQTQLQLEFIPEAKLKSLLRNVKSAERAKDEAVATLRGHIAQAVEKNFLDKTAFALFRRFEKMDDDKLHTVWAHLMHMMTVTGTLERAQTEPEAEELEPVDTSPGEDESIVRIGRGRRSKASESGEASPVVA